MRRSSARSPARCRASFPKAAVSSLRAAPRPPPPPPARGGASLPKAAMSSLRPARSLAAALLLCATPAAAQSVERFTIDSVVSVDTFGGDNVSSHPQFVVDISSGLRIDDQWQAVFRPWFRQLRPPAPGAAAPDSEAAILQAGLRYERPGTIGTRIDLGYMVSPIGLGMLDSRASLHEQGTTLKAQGSTI